MTNRVGQICRYDLDGVLESGEEKASEELSISLQSELNIVVFG